MGLKVDSCRPKTILSAIFSSIRNDADLPEFFAILLATVTATSIMVVSQQPQQGLVQ